MSYRNPSPRQSSRLSTSVRLGVAAVAACFIAAPVFSNPVNPTVVNGTASFNQAGNVLTVTNSNGAIINWDKFSIQHGETTHFAQTAASSSVMNRVLNDPTAIYGTLSSNGRVFLVNPAGIMVGPGGRVDTAGFVASTLNIRNEDFLAGRNLFINDGGAKDVINQGEIKTPAGGSVYLIGSNVSNEGIITTPQGETILAAGATVSLIDSATPGVKVDITGAEGNATNLGTITAEAGRIGIAGVIVRNSSQLNASSVVNEGGRIFLKASQDAYVDGNGRIVTTGTKGGSVEVLGNTVTVTDKAEIDASGTNGGGRIMVGGDYQGKNPDIQNASVSYFGPNASLKADATEVGDGGTVIVWADDTTRAYGNISARGGALGGDGGFVEISGKQSLDFAAHVNTLAPHGKTGTLLLDPGSMSINDASWLASYQSLGTDLILQTDSSGTGNIDFSGSGAYNTFGHNLKVLAYGVDASTGNISFTDFRLVVAGDLTLAAGWNGVSTGTPVLIPTKGDIVMSGATLGTWIQAATMNVAAGNNLTLTGGSGNISGPQGPGIMLMSTGTQTVTAKQILLQAGSANNTMYGGDMSGGSVGIWSDADQTISANVIKLYGGASGHDNAAGFHAYGGQAINITGSGGLLELKGGGDSSTAVYGGAGSYNNQARIEHGQWVSNNFYTGTGNQTITIYGGGSVNLQAGSGTGALGYYSNDCYATPLGDACRGSSNDAAIYNGVGAQTLDFVAAGSSLAIMGGSAGTQNWAGINNQFTATTQTINGNAAITVTGGSGGGNALSYGGDTFQLSNDAGINSQGSGDQAVNASAITLNGGNAAYGGAGISNDSGYSNYITTVGNLSMYGGGSSAGDEFAGGVYIGNKNGGAIDLQIGGNLYVKAGSGTSSPAVIGTVDGPGNVSITTEGNVDIIADGSGVGIGSLSTSSGATVDINSGGSLTVNGSATRGVLIGSLFDSGAVSLDGNGIAVGSSSRLTANSNLSLLSQNDLSLAGSLPVTSYGGAIRLVAGWNGGTDPVVGSISALGRSFTTFGGSFTAHAGNGIQLGSINTNGSCGVDGGDVDLTVFNGTLGVRSISALGGFDGAMGGNVTLWSKGNMTVGYGGNIAIDSTGGQGGWGDYGYDSAGSAGGTGGKGGEVKITSQAGNIAVYGSIVANGGVGGDGGEGGYAGSGVVHGFNGGQGGTGGQGGGIVLRAAGIGGSIALDATTQLHAKGGAGGDGGEGGYSYSSYGGDGGAGGLGGNGGGIELRADAGSSSISLVTGAQLDAGGAYGGNGGYSGYSGYGGYGDGTGGVGGAGGSGGRVNVFGGDILGNALFVASGGIGGAGRDAVPTVGAGGNGGHVGLDTTGGISLDNFQVAVNGGGTGAAEGRGGDILIAFDGALSYSAPSMLTALRPSSSIQLATGNVLTIATALSTLGTLQLTSGAGLVINATLGGYNVELGAPIIDINAPVTASNNAALGGATINLYAGVTAGGSSATKSSIVIDGIAYAYSGVAFAAKDFKASGCSAFLKATHSTSDVSGLVTGNITLDNGAYFRAGHDVDLTLKGSESTLSLSNGGYILADAPTTISLAFTSRSSGGVMIDGLETIKPGPSGSGLYAGSYGNAATPGAGLSLAYASNVVVDPCVINPALCKQAYKPPTDSGVPPPPPPKGAGDDLSKNTGGTEGTFGGEESGSGDNDEKDKKDKDKKSDEAKDEKKDEKPAQKKVAQCS